MTLENTIPGNVGMSSERLACIKPAMRAWIDRGVIIGASMMVARHNKIVYRAEIGQMDKEAGAPMSGNAIFRIYSMTKPIICTALMTLYEEGRFQLMTPASKFIPALGGLKVLRQDPSGTAKEEDLLSPITVGDLMKHTAGFTYDMVDDSPVAELYREAQLVPNAGRTLEQFVDTLVRLPLAHHPGTGWHYGVSTDVAAHLIEILTDKPLGDVLQERIFGPLDMIDTGFFVPQDKLPRCAAMYGAGDIAGPGMTALKWLDATEKGVWGRLDVDSTYPAAHPETFARGGHGLFSTTRDYMRFALMLLGDGVLDGARILGRKTTELMHVNHLPDGLLPFQDMGFTFDGYGFGLGSRTMMDIGAAGIPGSVGEFGWGGAASTYYWVDPVEELVGVFMTQYQGMQEPDKDFRVLVYQAISD
uniref:CubicO group peptidase, beta-lactamase class C family n=1 Tax=Candidatus Kentrum sp. TC TaxID=2126339 RepID=A0A451A4P2_9GAMM|nr:MAG: CubicO group peptidase, beta-lactamase class C family [Candidatus Kentron sp. TC]VFK51575.1 MAG: CubicO group peptidase, beta-lactamase class C family [Candidatus Kentron sp. TC]VFK60988.1 MAG: CubicO group peptidase, beta-lactamase class C family [Candidatus Kentron sp. TC]